jgi:hypothetical protein
MKTREQNFIKKPELCQTLRVLHNLWLDGDIDIFKMDKILRKNYNSMIQHLEPDFVYVESLDGLVKTSIGIKNN